MTVHQLFPAEHRFTNRKTTPANNSYEPQDAPDLPLDGIEYVSTRQMAWACAVLFVVIVAVSFLPISI